MSDLKERYKSLVEKAEKLKQDKIQMETKIQVLNSQLSEQMEKLKRDYGINSIEEGKEEVDRLYKQIESVLDDCEKKLSDMEV